MSAYIVPGSQPSPQPEPPKAREPLGEVALPARQPNAELCVIEEEQAEDNPTLTFFPDFAAKTKREQSLGSMTWRSSFTTRQHPPRNDCHGSNSPASAISAQRKALCDIMPT
jgi:hypothetical protein